MKRPARPTVGDFDFGKASRALLEQHARESFVYWHTSGPGPKPLSTKVCATLDAVLEESRRLRPLDEINAELADLCRTRSALPRPYDLDEVSRINRRIEELCREPSAESAGEASPASCNECAALRARLTNIYHLTLTGGNALSTLVAIRGACGPGAPDPCPCWATRSCRYPTCPRIPAPPPLGPVPARFAGTVETPFGPATVDHCEAEDA